MNNRYAIVVTFLAGLGGGWFGKTWFQSHQTSIDTSIATIAASNQRNDGSLSSVPIDSGPTWPSGLTRSSPENKVTQDRQESGINTESQRLEGISTGISITGTFDDLLADGQYYSAITLLQEQTKTDERNAAKLKLRVLKELDYLIEARNNSDFSELIDNYLSVYYDDIDALLLLAEFNQVIGSYLEVVNVFLLAKTYAYSESDQEKVTKRFNRFVLDADSSYTSQTNWSSLINLYAHINTSGLMTSTYQYRQAMAHLRSGGEVFAIEQFNQLLSDSQVGEPAAKALSSLVDKSEPATIVYSSPWEIADAIALQKLGNQYALKLNNARGDSVKLLIDTGASMTAMSRESFETINASGDAVEQDRRVFRTANGLVQATVFMVPELILGSHRLENTQIAVLEDFGAGRRIDGLLGMNILGQFRFQIDQESSQLRLIIK